MKKKHPAKANADQIRTCREVICPFCDHRYMWLDAPNPLQATYYYRSNETGAIIPSSKCPNCGEEIIMEPHILLGKPSFDEKYERIGIRGI